MKSAIRLFAFVALAIAMSHLPTPSHAELIDNGDGLIYDTVLDITWAQPELATPPPAGYRSWDDANAWAAGLTLGGVSGWRLPYASVAVGAGQLVDQPVDCTMASEAECADHELAYMFYYNLSGTIGESILLSEDPDLALFPDLSTLAPYWTGTQRNVDGVPEEGVPDTAWLFSFLDGNWRDSERKREVKATWAVHDGNVGAPFSPNVAYALDIGSDFGEFYEHEIGDLSNRTVTGAQTQAIFGMDFDPTATTLYALNYDTQELGTLSLEGVFTPIGPSSPLLGGEIWTGLAIDPVDGTFFASASNGTQSTLYRLDPETGAATFVGTDAQLDIVIDISINCEGVMYAHEIVTDSIHQINRTTGEGFYVGDTGIDSNFAQGMDFDNLTGTLYAYTYQGGGANQYGTISLTTGRFTPLSIDTPQGPFEGAMATICPIFYDGFESGSTFMWSETVP